MAQGQASTFSICGLDRETGEIGVAVQSKYFAVGSVVLPLPDQPKRIKRPE